MTADEAKALGHPTRLRMIFACRDRDMTNKDLAEALGTTPGTIHYHLRPLVAQGFLVPLEPRPGPRGSREQPYRATGRSWELAGSDATIGALRAVAADELLTAADEQVVGLTRLGLTLTGPERDELIQRLGTVLEEAFARTRHRRSGPRDREDPSDPAHDGQLEEVTVLLAVTVGGRGSPTTG
jgi:DNA-binding transcriptional ArsR family regulator